jgi:hypothetical protein
MLPQFLVTFLASKYAPVAAWVLTFASGATVLVPLIQGAHPVAAGDIGAFALFATTLLHALNGSMSGRVAIAKAATLDNAVPKVAAAVAQKRLLTIPPPAPEKAS